MVPSTANFTIRHFCVCTSYVSTDNTDNVVDDNERDARAVCLQEFKCTPELNACLFRPRLHHLDIVFGVHDDTFIIIMLRFGNMLGGKF